MKPKTAELLDLKVRLVTSIDGTDHELILELEQSTEGQAALMPSILDLGSAHACEDRLFLQAQRPVSSRPHYTLKAVHG